MDRRTLLRAAAALPLAGAALVGASAETWEEQHQKQLKEDWPWLGRYAEENRRLLASGAKVDIVFMGDSITEGWLAKRPGFFAPGRICRGISGQTTPQMVLRMMQDVVDLRPRAVHIMAGTNDIAGNTGPMTAKASQDNFRAMVAIARQHGIRPILASVPPASAFPWRQGLETVRPIRALNEWLEAFARQSGSVWVDYTPALADAAGGMKPGLAYDGVHPTEAGYDAMAKVVEPVLARLIGRRKRA